MNQFRCEDCESTFDTWADTCPHCGEGLPEEPTADNFTSCRFCDSEVEVVDDGWAMCKPCAYEVRCETAAARAQSEYEMDYYAGYE